jgi:hypothetical protein
MSNFAELKKARANTLQQIKRETSKLNEKKSYADDRFWQPTVDKAGNGFALIRFLPAPAGEDMPYVQLFKHGFKGPGGWYIENSLTTLDQPDPLGNYNTSLWNNGTESGKEQARKQKRKLQYISNIYVIKDSGNPENNGKVFLYRYGKKIFDKIDLKMNPGNDIEEQINPYDMWAGTDFMLKIRKVGEFRNYDSSEFNAQSALLDGDDDALEQVYNQEHSLQQFLAETEFKSYAELEVRMKQVLGLGGGEYTSGQAETAEAVEEPPVLRTSEPPGDDTPPWGNDDDSEDLSYFEELASEK